MTTFVPVAESGPAGDWANSRAKRTLDPRLARQGVALGHDDAPGDLSVVEGCADPREVCGKPCVVDDTIDDISSSRADRASLYWHARALRARLIDENDRLRDVVRASYATAERILAAAIADDLHVEPDTLAPRLPGRSVRNRPEAISSISSTRSSTTPSQDWQQ
jgi:hypothetical protein